MSRIVFRTLCGISLAALVAVSMCSCSTEPPKNGVQVKLTNQLSDDELTTLNAKLKELDSGITSVSQMTINGETFFNLSPVADAKAYSKKLTFGTVKSVNGNVITFKADPAKLGGEDAADPSAEDGDGTTE